MDETSIKVKGEWKYLYRAVDTDGQTIDFLLTAKRDAAAALRFFRKAMRHHGEPEVVTIDKSGANTAALTILNAGKSADGSIRVRQSKHLNNWWNRITEISSAGYGPCWDSNHFGERRRYRLALS